MPLTSTLIRNQRIISKRDNIYLCLSHAGLLLYALLLFRPKQYNVLANPAQVVDGFLLIGLIRMIDVSDNVSINPPFYQRFREIFFFVKTIIREKAASRVAIGI